MKRRLRTMICLAVSILLVFSQALTAAAAGTQYTIDSVNFRTGPSLDADVMTTLVTGTAVSLGEQAWSKVSHGGNVGYIRSDFLEYSSGSEPRYFSTNDNVNFRTGSSLDSAVISTLPEGTQVEMLEAGWSKVTANGSTGYVRSDFLSVNPPNTPSAASGNITLMTNDGVNMRSGPSTDNSIIATLGANTSVTVLEQGSNGWSRVSYNGNNGYIRSDLLSTSGRNVELLEWSTVINLIEYRTTIRVYDVRTGTTFNIQCFSKGDHADVETITKEDTASHLRTHNGIRSWNARPVWVTIGGRTIAASLHGMPHDVSWIADNDMNGHLCLHFLGSTTSSSSASYRADLQNAVQEAWDAR